MTLVTGIYAMCSTSCPEILVSAKGLLDSLPPDHRRRVVVVALSLNPEYDTASLMERVAEGYGFAYPQFRYLNGEPERMFDLLARLGFSRSVDRETGVVNHSNLFLLLDADGKIAYRFGLDGRKSDWLRAAALQLAQEAAEREMLATAPTDRADVRGDLHAAWRGAE